MEMAKTSNAVEMKKVRRSLIKSDGNGGLVIQKWFALVATTTMFLVTLASFIWGCATNYAMQASIAPFKERFEKLEARTDAIERMVHDAKLIDAEKFARIEGKVDYLIKMSKGE